MVDLLGLQKLLFLGNQPGFLLVMELVVKGASGVTLVSKSQEAFPFI